MADLTGVRFDVDEPSLVMGIVDIDEKAGSTRADDSLQTSPAIASEVLRAQ